MEWAEVIEHPVLRDLPFKIETNRHGQVVLSPASNRQGLFQAAIATRISLDKTDGHSQTECAVTTSEGVKVADVAWISGDFLKRHRHEIAYSSAPELCVEILSPSNTVDKIDEKSRLYFQYGALEVWICNQQGDIKFLSVSGVLLTSRLFPRFPIHIDIE